jgi:two-component system, NtrC family, response regulator AtoC
MDRSERTHMTVLVVDDDAAMRDLLTEHLGDEGYRVEAAPGGRTAVDRVKQGGVDLVITDIRMPDLDGLDVLRELQSAEGAPTVITITAFGSIENAIRAMKLGAYDYLCKPFDIEEVSLVVDRAMRERRLRHEVATLRREVQRPYRLGNLVGVSDAMRDVFDLVRRLSQATASVLITGESGTGKELVARALHYNSARARKPFVAVNCAAIPETLLESELFGHKRGAFTDARADHTGLVVEADGGTLFLDEIAELSPALQAKLLRVLQDREVRPVGASRSEKVDVRVIAATNREIDALMRDGRFREDLFYRLNVVGVRLPALRERTDDILPLCEHFLVRAAERAGRPAKPLAPAAAKLLVAYPWPGNVRELENVVERAVALSDQPEIGPHDLPPALRDRKADPLAAALGRRLTLEEVEREYILRVLQDESGNKTRAAARLGLDRKTLYRKLEEYGRGDAPDDDEPTATGK